MSEFMILFKHELKMLFPILSFNKKKKHDYVGSILSILLSALIIGVFIVLVSKIANGYVGVKFNKIISPKNRAAELLNILYLFITVLLVVGCIKKMSSTLTDKRNSGIYLRLPVKEKNLLLSKLSALMIWNFIFSILLIVPVNIIFYIALKPTVLFWFKTLFTLITMPLVVFGLSTILLVPVIKVVNFLKDKYLLLFAIISAVLIGTFLLYTKLLNIIKLWLETGSIKFLFNHNFVSSLQTWLKWSYPSNCFANIMTGNKVLISLITIILTIALSVAVAISISKKLFYLTLYKRDNEKRIKHKTPKYKQSKPIVALIRKEFTSVYRTPKYLFSYFAIAVSLPVMTYCCYTLFESLIVNAFGLKITFSLAVFVLLLFSIMTNTFCATNVSRDGHSFLKMKSLAIKTTHLLFAKVAFCVIVSTISILLSVIVLAIFTDLTILQSILCFLVATLFSTAQILVATRLDLNHVKFSSTSAENEVASNKTITKVIFIGVILAFAIGLVSVLVNIFAEGSGIAFISKLNLKEIHAYIWPFIVSLFYFAFATFFYNFKIDKSFNSLAG